MKKAISKLLLAAVFMLCYISAFAHDFEVDGVYYKILNSTNKTLEVTYQGSSYSSYSNEYAGEVDVPSTVAYNGATYTVVSIGSSAFRDCITLTSVTIPEGVTAINSYAFSGCVCLTSVTIPACVTSIAQYAFNGCTGLSEVTIPGVTSIGNYAFAACSGVKNVAIGESITSIGAYAFSGCTGLTSITIPESTTSIGNKAFENCTAMTTVNFNAKDCSMGSSDHPVFTNCTHISTINIGENVEVIPAYAFKGCSGLTSIAIPEGVTSIYTYAFYGCSGMKEVTIPKSVASIGTYAFYGCSSLTSVVIPDGVTTIRDYTFCNCYSLATVEIPESVTSIGVRAFEDCDGMTTITIPGSVTSIDNYAFYHCSKLAEISIPNSVTSVGDYLFLDCSKLENVVIPESISSISAYTFQGCKALASVNIPGSITTIGKGAFHSSGLKALTIPGSVTSIGQYAFYDCDSLSQISIPDSVISIDSYAFSECGALGTVTIPNSVIYLGSHAFYNSDGLKQIVIPESLSLIRDYTFYDCDGLTEVTIPNSVTSIGEQAFYYCYNLVSLTLGSNLSSIGNRAFYKCSDLNVIHATGSIPPSLYDSDVFYQVNKTIPVYVPTGCVEAYKKASYWSSFSTILEEENTEPLPDGAPLYVDNVYYLVKSSADRTLCVTYKGDSYSSYSGEYYGEIVIPDSVTFHGVTYAVTEIGTEAFRGCTGLITLTIGKNIKSIGNLAFYDCSGLIAVNFNAKNCTMSTSNFQGCNKLSTVNIGDGVEVIPDYAFYNCDGLKEITIPDSVITIGTDAFSSCDNLTDVTIGNSVTSIGEDAFEYSGLTSVSIPNSVTSIGNYAFYNCTKLRKLTLQDGKATLSLGANSSSNGLFDNCPIDTLYIGRNLSYQYAPFKNIEELKSVTIGDKVTRIGNSLFSSCSGLTSVAMGKNVTAIGNSVFYNCDGLKEITIPDSVITIGTDAFSSCDNLTDVTIGNSVTSIGEDAFEYSGLTSVSIPNSVTSIGNYAFYHCSGLTSVAIGKNVTSIGNSAFSYCSNLAEIHVKATTPPTLANGEVFYNVNKSIPVYVPAGCASAYRNATYWKAFTNIIALSDDVFVSGGIYYKITSEEEGTVAVTFCGGTYNEYTNEYTGSVSIPESVTHNDVVYRVTSIANEAFRNCTTLTKVDIPNSITSIGDYAFATCTGLTTVTIGNGVAAIGNRAFENCHALKSISIPQGVTSIGNYAFSTCIGLTEITIPGSVTSIGIGALAGCSGINSIAVEEGNTMYDSRDNCNAIVETATNKLVAGCKNSVIPGSVTAIGDYAFSGVTGLRTILIPQDVTSIGVSAFSGCSGLEEIGVEAVVPPTIVATTFDGVNKSIRVYVPAGCAEVYRNVEYWQEFTNIKEVAIIVNGIHYKITSAENKTMAITSRGDGNDKYAGVVEIPQSVIYNDVTYKVTSIGEKAFMDCTDLTSVVIPNSITSISQSAFFGCTGLTEMTIPNSVTSIGIGALAGCSGLKSIVVEEGNAVYDSRGNCNAIVETATNTLIAGCNNTVIPADVVSIGDGAFYGCSGLISITIPEGVALIGVSAFEDCIGLTEMHVNAINPPTVRVNTFSNVDKTIPVYVPEGCASVYRNAEGWSEFTNIIGLPDGAFVANDIYYMITSEENKTVGVTFKGSTCDEHANEYAGEMVIPASVVYGGVTYRVTAIGKETFRGCTALTSIVIPASVTSMGEGVFYNCYGLTSVTIPASVTAIGEYAFLGCAGLASIVVEEGNNVYDSRESCNAIIKTATNRLIVGCKNTVIPESVTAIGEDAFYGCTGLASVTIPECVTTIGEGAFSYCTGLTEIHIEATTPPTIYSTTFNSVSRTIPVHVPLHCAEVYRNAEGWREFTNIIAPVPLAIVKTTPGEGEEVDSFSGIVVEFNKPVYIANEAGATVKDAMGETIATLSAVDASLLTTKVRLCTALPIVTDGAYTVNIPAEMFATDGNEEYNANTVVNFTVKSPPLPVGTAIEVDGIYYKVTNSDNRTVEVTFKGSTYYEYTDEYTGEVEIPENVTFKGAKYSVIAIGQSAFKDCASLTSVVIPGSVTSIGAVAFEDCAALKGVTIGNGVTAIGDYAFYNCIELASVNIPEGVTTIGKSAFNGCSSLASVDVPNSVTSLGGAAFEGCTALYSITIGNGVTAIGDYTFYKCTTLTSITIPEKVATIGQSAFQACSSLREIISEAITPPTVKTNTFNQVDKSIPVYVPSGSAEAYRNAIYWREFNDIKDVEINIDGIYYKVTNSDNRTVEVTYKGDTYDEYTHEYTGSIVIPESITYDGVTYSVTSIGRYAFKGCTSLASVDIPNSVTSLGGAAFEGCTALYSVTIGNGVTAIGDYTFYKCTTLTSVTIPEKVATIGQSAFQACSSLREIISEAITPPTVKTNTFNQVDKSIPVYVPEWSVDNYRKASFWNQFTNIIGVANGVIVVNGVYYKKTSDEDKTVEVTFCGRSYDEYAGEYTGEVEIPDSVTYQGVVYSVTAIGKSAFKGCTSLTSVVIPGSVTEIGGAAFEGCTALNSVTIGNAVTAIGDYAFYKCVALTSVTIPENVAMIGLSAFQACTGFVEIVSEAITPPAIESTTFSYVDKSIPLYVPGGCADAYSMADYWSEFTYIEEIGAVDEVSFAAETIKVGAMKEFSLPISMKNSMPVVGVQCDIELPDGLTAVKNNGNYEVTLSSRANDYRVETILRQDGLLRVLIYPKSVSPIVIYDEELYIIKNSYIDKQESAQSAQEKNLEYPTAPKPISGRNGELFTITLMPNEHYSTNDNVVIRNAEAITRSYSIQEIADLVIACTVQGDATGDESDVSDIDNVESATRVYAAGNKIVIESPQAQKAQIIMMDGLVLRKFLQPGHNEIPMQQGIYIVSVGSIAKKIVIR